MFVKRYEKIETIVVEQNNDVSPPPSIPPPSRPQINWANLQRKWIGQMSRPKCYDENSDRVNQLENIMARLTDNVGVKLNETSHDSSFDTTIMTSTPNGPSSRSLLPPPRVSCIRTPLATNQSLQNISANILQNKSKSLGKRKPDFLEDNSICVAKKQRLFQSAEKPREFLMPKFDSFKHYQAMHSDSPHGSPPTPNIMRNMDMQKTIFNVTRMTVEHSYFPFRPSSAVGMTQTRDFENNVSVRDAQTSPFNVSVKSLCQIPEITRENRFSRSDECTIELKSIETINPATAELEMSLESSKCSQKNPIFLPNVEEDDFFGNEAKRQSIDKEITSFRNSSVISDMYDKDNKENKNVAEGQPVVEKIDPTINTSISINSVENDLDGKEIETESQPINKQTSFPIISEQNDKDFNENKNAVEDQPPIAVQIAATNNSIISTKSVEIDLDDKENVGTQSQPVEKIISYSLTSDISENINDSDIIEEMKAVDDHLVEEQVSAIINSSIVSTMSEKTDLDRKEKVEIQRQPVTKLISYSLSSSDISEKNDKDINEMKNSVVNKSVEEQISPTTNSTIISTKSVETDLGGNENVGTQIQPVDKLISYSLTSSNISGNINKSDIIQNADASRDQLVLNSSITSTRIEQIVETERTTTSSSVSFAGKAFGLVDYPDSDVEFNTTTQDTNDSCHFDNDVHSEGYESSERLESSEDERDDEEEEESEIEQPCDDGHFSQPGDYDSSRNSVSPVDRNDSDNDYDKSEQQHKSLRPITSNANLANIESDDDEPIVIRRKKTKHNASLKRRILDKILANDKIIVPSVAENSFQRRCRRSKRLRVKPLNFWCGERPIYKAEQINGSSVLSLVGATAAQMEPLRRKLAPRKKRKPSRVTEDTRPIVEPVAPAIIEQKMDNILDLSIQVKKYKNLSKNMAATDAEHITPYGSIQFNESKNSPGLYTSITKKAGDIAMGKIKFDPEVTKTTTKTGDYVTYFNVVYGTLLLKVESKPDSLVKTGSLFEIGPNMRYSIINTRSDQAMIDFNIVRVKT